MATETEDEEFARAIAASMQDQRPPAQIDPNTPKPNINDIVKRIAGIFEDIDENFIKKEVQAHSGEQQFEEQLMETIVQMNGQYPKKKQQSGIKKISEKKLREAKGDTNEIYKHLTWLYLWNEFGKVPLEELYNALQKFNFHLFPCVEYLEQNFKFRGRSGNIEDRKFTLLPFNRNYVTINLEEDDEFRNEYILVEKMRSRLQIIQKLEKQNEENQIGLYECPICTLKYPMDDIVQCTQGHMICQFCVEDNVISGLEQGKVFIDCIAEGDCKGHYSESVLLSCLSDDDLFRLDSIRMNQEIGNILKMMKGVVECPHCEYKAIIEDENNFIFECKNPRCGKKTCRKCWKDAHTPFKCKKELEDAAEQMRKFVEEYMTNAASCQCENCHARLVKEVGCNKIKCKCGQYICYICKKIIDQKSPYSHFKDPPGNIKQIGNAQCPLYENSAVEDERRAQEARVAAEAEWRKLHPGFIDAALNTIGDNKRTNNTRKRR